MPTKFNLRPVIAVAALTLITSAQFLSSGCVGGGDGGGAVVYGDGPWIQNDVIVEGGGAGWYGRHDDHAQDHDRGYVHPNAGGHPAESHPNPSPAVHANVSVHGPEEHRN